MVISMDNRKVHENGHQKLKKSAHWQYTSFYRCIDVTASCFSSSAAILVFSMTFLYNEINAASCWKTMLGWYMDVSSMVCLKHALSWEKTMKRQRIFISPFVITVFTNKKQFNEKRKQITRGSWKPNKNKCTVCAMTEF